MSLSFLPRPPTNATPALAGLRGLLPTHRPARLTAIGIPAKSMRREMLISFDNPQPVWLLVRSKPKQELALVQALAGRDVAAYCPKVIEPRWHARAPHVPVPLFPSYIFAYCVPMEKYSAVRYCPGAAGIVRFGQELGAVEDEFVANLREREGERGYLVIGEARRAPAKGSRVRVIQGPFAGIEGIVTHYLPAKDRVRLLLTMVSGVRKIEVDARHIRSA